MLFFIPQIIKSLGNFSNMEVGWMTMIPYICGGISMVAWGRISDRMNEQRWNLFGACVVSTVRARHRRHDHGNLVGARRHVDRRDRLLRSKGPFWAMPPMFLTGMAAAGAIAWINSIGNLGGFFGSGYVGWMKDLTGSYAGHRLRTNLGGGERGRISEGQSGGPASRLLVAAPRAVPMMPLMGSRSFMYSSATDPMGTKEIPGHDPDRCSPARRKPRSP